MIYKYKEYNLSYNIGGDKDGFPVFINYGLVGDIELGNLNKLAVKEGLKLVILERPGYGNSDYIEMNSYNDWGEIVASFFDYLNIDDFSIIGISAGAPYTYSVANKMSDRVKDVYILSGVPFLLDESVFEKYEGKDDFYKKIWNYSKKEIQEEMYSILKKYNNLFFKLILPKSVKNEFKATLSNDCAGVGQSVSLQIKDWGFDIYKIPTKINFWHSKNDKEVPFDAVKIMTDKMMNAELHVKGKQHLPSKDIIEEVFFEIRKNK